ncbi:MAG: SH3 domain-containing protein [Bacteroidota bacterium]
MGINFFQFIRSLQPTTRDIFWVVCWAISLASVTTACNSTATEETSVSTDNSLYALEDKFLVPDTIVLSTMAIDPNAQAEWINYTEGIPVKNAHFEPVDQGPLNPYFVSFRDSLIQALHKQDLKFLVDHIDEKVAMSNEQEAKKSEFLQEWNLQGPNPERSSLWGVLLTAVETGGIFSSNEFNFFICPYSYVLDLDDTQNQKVVIGTEVRIRERPGLTGEVLGSLTYEVVDVLPLAPEEQPVFEEIGGDTYSWERIKTSKGIVGYVYGKFLRNPLDFRVFFAFQRGKWTLSALASGD